MGIVNVTPDSFYDGGKSFSEKEIINQASKMLDQGATFLDVGGYSSRAGAAEVSVKEEIERVLLAVNSILKHFPEAIISVDTFRSEVARVAIENGAAIINDISGGNLDKDMYRTVGELKVPYILMHMRGTPKTMTTLTDYKNVTTEIIEDLSKKIARAKEAEINDIVVDPGFGLFAKNIEQNFQLLSDLDLFKNLEAPILVGVSRKSFIYKTLGLTPKEALNGTTSINTISLLKGASILRVHDVKEAVECVKLFKNLNP